MSESKVLTKEDRIKKELARIKRQFSKIEKKKKAVVDGLFERAAFMRIELEDMEKDIQENGMTEKFSQGNQDPYDRQRPMAQLYNSTNANYQKILKQLTDLLPKDDKVAEKKKGEELTFDSFVAGRED